MPAQPQDRKKKTAEAAVRLGQDFVYELPDGETITIPPMTNLSAGVLRRLRSKSELEFMFGVLEDVMDEENLERLDRLNMSEVDAVFKAWQKEGGVSAGES